jgi:threonine dehydratase
MKLPALSGIEDALRRVRAHELETPLVRSELLSRALEADVWLKNETVSTVASFKLRGAVCALGRAGSVSQAVPRRQATTARASPGPRGPWTSRRTCSCRRPRTR